ncbi:acyl-CoA thioesterase [Alkalicoccus luteus]|uniref:Acyl-CoA thioesterase n=1 Tax=Alkalicoccus luteus TaxID=1237094 RepID=A0A969PN14_9BACI|nr:thioesterase family protein [Alkalicoccus luteus]NJP37220.1 acyl-CoA thioesterase [Alkalicoccus luteus]
MINQTDISVRYAETDQMGVVYHANYLVWCEVGRTALMADLGIPYHDMEAEGILAPVISIEAAYKSPARFGDKVTVHTQVAAYNGLRVTYNYNITAGDKLCMTGTSEHVLVDAERFRPRSMKKKYPVWHEVYEKAAQSFSHL